MRPRASGGATARPPWKCGPDLKCHAMGLTAEDYYRQGILFHDAGRFADAVAAFDLALMSAPQVAVIHYGRGNSLVMQHRVEEALGAYEQCLALDPGHIEASYNRSRALVQLQRWQEALNALDRFLEQRSDIADA
jgi:tetratricopeptide (TPR) repeat protein